MIEVGENPANWMLRVMSLESMGDLSATYKNSETFKMIKQDLDRIKENQVPEMEIKYDNTYAASQVQREELVNSRLRTIYWRSPAYNLTRLSVSGIIAFILGSIFLWNWRRSQFTEIEMRARLSVIFLSFIITGIMSICSVLPVMQDIKMMFRRHADAGMYGSKAIGIALGVAEKWFIVAGGTIFTAIFLSTSHINNKPFSAGFWVRHKVIKLILVCRTHSPNQHRYIEGILYFQPCHLFLHRAGLCVSSAVTTDCICFGYCLHRP